MCSSKQKQASKCCCVKKWKTVGTLNYLLFYVLFMRKLSAAAAWESMLLCTATTKKAQQPNRVHRKSSPCARFSLSLADYMLNTMRCRKTIVKWLQFHEYLAAAAVVVAQQVHDIVSSERNK